MTLPVILSDSGFHLGETAIAYAAHFRKTGGQVPADIIDFEHSGDAL
jgi:hypothetical protein